MAAAPAPGEAPPDAPPEPPHPAVPERPPTAGPSGAAARDPAGLLAEAAGADPARVAGWLAAMGRLGLLRTDPAGRPRYAHPCSATPSSPAGPCRAARRPTGRPPRR